VAGGDPRIEDYLDHVCAPLVGKVEYAERMALRTELRAHLEALADASREVGMDADAAVRDALARFGPPHVLAADWLRAGRRGAAGVASARQATLIALGCFGIASSLFYALAMLASLSPEQDLATWSPLAMVQFCFLAPITAGLITGLTAPARHALGVFYALATLVALGALRFWLPFGDSPTSATMDWAGV
jgi:hypothetical protein